MVTDLGAGTGLLTRGLLAHGYQVVAVEPSAAMCAAANHLLAYGSLTFALQENAASGGESTRHD